MMSITFLRVFLVVNVAFLLESLRVKDAEATFIFTISVALNAYRVWKDWR